MYSANISPINPLKSGHFVLAMKPSTGHVQTQVILGEGLSVTTSFTAGADLSIVLTMYTKSTHHDWISIAESVGTPSYIYVLVYLQLGGNFFSSLTCQALGCPTVLQIPRTHILFSLASYTIARQASPTADGHPHTLVTLCKDSHALFQIFQQHSKGLHVAIDGLAKSVKAKGKNADGGSAHLTIVTAADLSGSDAHSSKDSS
jgi:hypothetical protein